MLKITDLTIDPKCLGTKFLLVGISPSYKFVNNTKSDTIDGYKYSVALPAHKLEKINIKVNQAKPLFDIDKDKLSELNEKLLEMPEVIFGNLNVKIYYIKETGYGVTATADSVRLLASASEKTKTEVKSNAYNA